MGKAIAEKTKPARDGQKKAFAEARVIIANNQCKEQAREDVSSDIVSSDTRKVLITTQWRSVIRIFAFLYRVSQQARENDHGCCHSDRSGRWHRLDCEKYGLRELHRYY